MIGEGLPPGLGRAARRARLVELLKRVGLDESLLGRRPHQLSGGQRQRIAIARALAPGPKVLVCDEPVSALDASVRAQIIALLDRLCHDDGVALVFITHDLGVVQRIADHIVVMKDGRVVERGPTDAVFADPRHEYTRALISAMPSSDPAVPFEPLRGE